MKRLILLFLALAGTAHAQAFVRTYGYARTSGSVGAATLSSLTFNLGDVAVMTVAWYTQSPTVMTNAITVMDTSGNSWAPVPNTFQNVTGGAQPPGQQLWWAIITHAGSGITFTATFPVTVYYPAVYGCEASGVNTIDQSTGNLGTGTETSGNITTTKANTFIYGSVYDGNGGSSGAGAGGGWTTIQATYSYYINMYQVAGSPGTFAATSNDAGSFLFTAAIVAFYSSSAPPPGSVAPVIFIAKAHVPIETDEACAKRTSWRYGFDRTNANGLVRPRWMRAEKVRRDSWLQSLSPALHRGAGTQRAPELWTLGRNFPDVSASRFDYRGG
jgi:hypothetical protein